MTRKRDFQKQRVYDFTNSYFRLNPSFAKIRLSKDQCTKMVASIFRDYGFDSPYWVSHFEDDYINQGIAIPVATCHHHNDRFLLNFPNRMRNTIVLLHEVSHAFAPGDLHGPLFMTTFLELMGRYRGIDVKRYRELAEEYGLKLAPREDCRKRIGASRKYLFRNAA